MLLRKNLKNVIDTLCITPCYVNNIKIVEINSGLTINHLKVNEDSFYQIENNPGENKPITSYNEDKNSKTPFEIYQMLGTWDNSTMLNAYFSHDFEAGTISGYGEEVEKVMIKRLSPDTNYSIYETVGVINFVKGEDLYFRDYLVTSGEVYLYSIQPVTKGNNYGQIQNVIAGLNQYEYSWIIDTDGNQIRIANSKISNIAYNTKDSVVETIGGKYPFVNRYSSLNYRTFTLSGTIATVLDIDKDVTQDATKRLLGTNANFQEVVRNKFKEKYGEEFDLKTEQFSTNNELSINSAYERLYRDKIVEIFENGKEKLYKSDTEGMMLVKFSNVNISPKVELGRLLYDFTVNVTEIGQVTPELIYDFNLQNKIPNFDVPVQGSTETKDEYSVRYDFAEFGQY